MSCCIISYQYDIVACDQIVGVDIARTVGMRT